MAEMKASTIAHDSSPRSSRSSTTPQSCRRTTVAFGHDHHHSGSAVILSPTPRSNDGSAGKPPRPSPRVLDGRRRSGQHHQQRQHRSPHTTPRVGVFVAPSPSSSGRKVGCAKISHREYRLLQSQTMLLAGTAMVGFILFLLFALPVYALVGLTACVTSMGACLLVASSAVRTWYELQLEHPLGLIRHLPHTARAYLTQKSLNEVLCPSASTESLPSLLSSSSRHSLSPALSRNSSSPALSRENSSSGGSLSSPALSGRNSSSPGGSMSSPALTLHNSPSRGSLSSSSLPREYLHRRRRRMDERGTIIGDGRPPQSKDAHQSAEGHEKDP